jgi:hypothetical protein
MQPARLIFPEALAANWMATLARDGLQVRAQDEYPSGLIAYAGREFRLQLHRTEQDGYWCDLSQISHRELYARVEKILLASGARFNLPEFVSSGFNALYRCDQALLHSVCRELRNLGITVEISGGRNFCGNTTAQAESFVYGRLLRAGNEVVVESGPAYDVEESVQAAFIEMQPRFHLRMGEGLRSLVREAGAELERQGAEPVLVFGSFAT